MYGEQNHNEYIGKKSGPSLQFHVSERDELGGVEITKIDCI